jgi:hypothetical protein
MLNCPEWLPCLSDTLTKSDKRGEENGANQGKKEKKHQERKKHFPIKNATGQDRFT